MLVCDARADALTAALWCGFHPQRRRNNISPSCLHLPATHTNLGTLVSGKQRVPGSNPGGAA